ncbi:response regulator receiver domain-containing protein [Archangium gephyra]|uniref:Diguanylate cyclase/phosphodiesterase n=1 Tax=Archangium gephyra TaxID=48 RepID=A0AAC8TBJ3_9BACT|nr:response regulator [Archangium gephyra]AKI99956.1 diguanylate cyclase/phosphodiesterase [Archangium gephyra]REG33335.1 response regulator receiver domain-containing protein [Archangium gephyra]
MSETERKRRILVIDDSAAIHQDFRRLLCPERGEGPAELAQLRTALFGAPTAPARPSGPEFEVESAFQGQEGVTKVREAVAVGRPYALVFLDYRMPPGGNGVETLRGLWAVHPSQRVVLCSAYSDYSWEDIVEEFGETPLLRELRKPVNGHELRQLALTLTEP